MASRRAEDARPTYTGHIITPRHQILPHTEMRFRATTALVGGSEIPRDNLTEGGSWSTPDPDRPYLLLQREERGEYIGEADEPDTEDEIIDLIDGHRALTADPGLPSEWRRKRLPRLFEGLARLGISVSSTSDPSDDDWDDEDDDTLEEPRGDHDLEEEDTAGFPALLPMMVGYGRSRKGRR